MMTDCCKKLDLFFDRELAPEAAEAFRDHLATCTHCQDALEDRMLEAALLATERPRHHSYPPPPPPTARPSTAAVHDTGHRTAASKSDELPGLEPDSKRRPEKASIMAFAAKRASRRLPMIAAIVASASGIGAAAVSVLMLGTRTVPLVAPLADVSLLPERPVEVRFSAPTLDHYRKFLVVRGAAPTPKEQISLQYLSALDARKDFNTLVGARALIGELGSAAQTAQTLPATATNLSDLAAIELLQAAGRPTRAEQEVGLHKVLSLASDALRLDKDNPQAAWNRALALRDLGLPLVAERVFGEIVTRNEPGWSDEARLNQQRMTAAHDIWNRWNKRKLEARDMARGGPVFVRRESGERLAACLLHDELTLAIATAATPQRLDALVPLATQLDTELATTDLSALIASVRRDDLAARAPIARALAEAMQPDVPHAALAEVRARALDAGFVDIALATFLVPRPAELDADDLAQLDRLLDGQRDPWWQLFRLERRAYAAEYVHRDYAALDAIARRAEPICATLRAASCIRITRIAGSAAGSMGRIDDALKQLADARQRAHDANLLDDEVSAIHAIGQLMAVRLTDQLDSSAVADAYLEEAAQRWLMISCSPRLQRLDFEAKAALLYHRFDDARAARKDADNLEGGACANAAPRFNGETIRAQLTLQQPDADQIDRLKGHVARLRKEADASYALWIDYLTAVEKLLADPSAGQRAMREVVRAATDAPNRPYASMVRNEAFDALVDAAAAAGRGDTVLALLADRLHVPDGAPCVLGVASWSRLIVAARDARGEVALEPRTIPPDHIRLPAADVVSTAMRQRLAGCPRIQVLAPGPYFGTPRLLDDEIAWSYRSGAAVDAPALPTRELVVSDVAPPDALHLPRLQRFEARSDGELLSGMAATPERVLARMADASLIIIVAHGFTDVSEPSAASLVLSPSPSGDYLLTASKVQAARLVNAPTVVLAGCDAGRVQVTNEPWSLATSFLQAGARTVIAPTEPIPDASADQVFRTLVDRLRSGEDPAVVLANQRRQLGPEASWLSSIVIFDR